MTRPPGVPFVSGSCLQVHTVAGTSGGRMRTLRALRLDGGRRERRRRHIRFFTLFDEARLIRNRRREILKPLTLRSLLIDAVDLWAHHKPR